MDQEFRKNQIAMNGVQLDITATNNNILKQGQDLAEMSLSQSHSFFLSPPRQKQPKEQQDINVPIQIEGQNFILEINDIQSIQVIDLADSGPPSKATNVLEQLNSYSIRDSKTGLTKEDKNFFKTIFDIVKPEPRGKDYVEQAKKNRKVNNFEEQFPEEIEFKKKCDEYDEYMKKEKKFDDGKTQKQRRQEAEAAKIQRILDDETQQKKIEDMNKKQRDKTLGCMLKVMDRQIDVIKQDAKEFT